MEDHGTVYETRFKLMRERIEAMKEIWTKSKASYHGDMVDFAGDDDLAQAGAEAPPADPGRRRLPAGGAARDPLWRRLVPDRRPARRQTRLAALEQFRQMAKRRRARPAIARR